MVSKGYFKNTGKTQKDFYSDENGCRWFRTGDIGQFADDGTLTIIDRKKDLVKLQMGEYISPGKVESVLKLNELVENVCIVVHPEETYCVALIVPNEAILKDLALANFGIVESSTKKICRMEEVSQKAALIL